MSPTLLEALLLFWLILTVLAGILYRYRLAMWWHEQRQIPRPVSLSPALPVPLPVRFPSAPQLQLERPLPVRLEPVSGELVLFEGGRYEGEVLGLLRLEADNGEG